MPDSERDPLEEWLAREIAPLAPPSGTFELIRKRARRRKVGRLAVTVTSAAAVVVAVAIAGPTVLSLHLGQSATGTQAANGRRESTATPATATPATAASATATAPSSRASTATSPASTTPTPSESTSAAGSQVHGPVPANFQPTSVTFIGVDKGWAIGQAGTPGHCENSNPTICTSIVQTTDGGQTWEGVPAPSTSQVTGIRFLNDSNGWAYGPALWSTHDGGAIWTQVNTDGQQVIDLETAGNAAFALFATCPPAATGSTRDCTSYTLKTTPAGTDDWVDVGPATTNLPDSAGATPTIMLDSTTGWLLAADGTVYSGPLTGAWTKLGNAPCPAAPPQAGGSLGGALLSSGLNDLVAACTTQPQATGSLTAQKTLIYTSGTSSLNWLSPTAAPAHGTLTALSATASAPAIVATTEGIWILDASGQWQQTASLASGFTYVGMTTNEQGIAIPANTFLHQIYMTYDGGQSWQAYTFPP